MLGSFLVILVVAICFGEFLEVQGVPRMASDWIGSMNLERWQFLLVVNLLLLVVGCLMDIMSAIFVFVPLLAPMAAAVGVDPIHFGIIFIVNLEIGYLTPPVGLNLFVASTLFGKPVGHITKSVLPFIAFMLIGLMIVTYFPEITLVGSRCGRMEVALRALRHHDFGLEQMISAVLPLERAGEAFELAQRRGIRKVLLRPVR